MNQDQLDSIEQKLDYIIALLSTVAEQDIDEGDDQSYYGERDQTKPL